MHSEQDDQNQVSSWLTGDAGDDVVGYVGPSDEAGSEFEDRALLRELAAVLGQLLSPSPTGADPAAEPTAFDPDATAVEIVTRGLDPELRAAVDADPHGTVLPRGGMTIAELDDLLASLVALAVHTATAAAEKCGSTSQEIVASAALRLRSV
jgi:hypothetical protein